MPSAVYRMESFQDREFVEYIVKHIVNKPDAVVVTRTTDEMGVLLEVKVDKEDMGLLIGRAGATAKAIRILARIIGMRNNARVNLRILEPEGGLKEISNIQNKDKNIDDVVNEIGM